MVYDISYLGQGTFSASSFNFRSDGAESKNPFHSAAHIQSIGDNGDSGWAGNMTVVPEPVSSALFIAGAETFGLRRLKKKRGQVKSLPPPVPPF